MRKLTPNDRVVCICRGGQVRSVATRYILADRFGFRRVLVCGWEKNDKETVEMLCRWADAVVVVGSTGNWWHTPDPMFEDKTHRLNIGEDRWGVYNHPELVALLTPLIERIVA